MGSYKNAHLTPSTSLRMPSAAAPRRATPPGGRCVSCLEAAARSSLVLALVAPVVVVVVLGARLAEVRPVLVCRLCAQRCEKWAAAGLVPSLLTPILHSVL